MQTTEREILESFVIAKKRLDELDEARKAAQLEYDRAESQLVQSLIDREAKSTAKYEGLGFATLSKPKVYASYDKTKEPEVFSFIEQQGEKELIKLTVHPQTLNGFVGRLIEGGIGVPEYMTYYLKQGVRFYARG